MWGIASTREYFYIVDATDVAWRAIRTYLKGDALTIDAYCEVVTGEPVGVFLGRLDIKKSATVIFMHSGKNAATFAAPVELEKQHEEKPIAEEDLASIFRKATLQFFNHFSEEARRRFRVDDVAILLANSRIMGLEFDGVSCINPLGMRARRAGVRVEQTFLQRVLHDQISAALPETCRVFHIESGAALYAVLRGKSGKAAELLVHVACGVTHLYRDQLSYNYQLPTGFKHWYETLGKEAGVPPEHIPAVSAAILRGDASERFAALFKRSVRTLFSSLLAECEKHISPLPSILFFTDEPLGSIVGESQTAKTSAIFIPNKEELSDLLHFGVNAAPRVPESALSPVFLAGLIAFIRRRGDNYEGASTKGSVNWLIPHNSI